MATLARTSVFCFFVYVCSSQTLQNGEKCFASLQFFLEKPAYHKLWLTNCSWFCFCLFNIRYMPICLLPNPKHSLTLCVAGVIACWLLIGLPLQICHTTYWLTCVIFYLDYSVFVCFVECESAIVYFFIRLLFTTYYLLPITSVSTLLFSGFKWICCTSFLLNSCLSVCVCFIIYILSIYTLLVMTLNKKKWAFWEMGTKIYNK